MNRKSLFVLPIAVALAGPLLLASGQGASAAAGHAGKGPQSPVATGQHAASSKTLGRSPKVALAGYQQVTSPLLTDTAGQQSAGSVACPTGTALVGGGAVISSSSLAENLNASIPLTDGLTWRVFVNNATSVDGTYRVYADCVKKVAKYVVVTGTGVDNPAGTQVTATVTCPTGTLPFGGGGYDTSGSTDVNLNTSIPTSKGWRTDVNNAGTGSDTASAYAICGKKPTGYVQVMGTAATVNANSQSSASATCPSGTLVLSGGGFSSSGSTVVDLNSTAPFGTGTWQSYESNGSTGASSLTTYAVCSAAS